MNAPRHRFQRPSGRRFRSMLIRSATQPTTGGDGPYLAADQMNIRAAVAPADSGLIIGAFVWHIICRRLWGLDTARCRAMLQQPDAPHARQCASGFALFQRRRSATFTGAKSDMSDIEVGSIGGDRAAFPRRERGTLCNWRACNNKGSWWSWRGQPRPGVCGERVVNLHTLERATAFAELNSVRQFPEQLAYLFGCLSVLSYVRCPNGRRPRTKSAKMSPLYRRA